MTKELQGKKVVLFGAGSVGRQRMADLLRDGITPAYFVDNRPAVASVRYEDKELPVKSPTALLSEDPAELRILITPLRSTGMLSQLYRMGFLECVYPPQTERDALVDTIARLEERVVLCESMLAYAFDSGAVEKRACPACGSEFSAFLPYGVIPRPDVVCPVCRSMERHRALWLYFDRHTDLFSEQKRAGTMTLLHFAPEQIFLDRFSRLPGVDYYPVDFNPLMPGIRKAVDIQSIPYPDAMFDVILCNHVLEHIPDDHTAMRELRRVLKPDGIAYLGVPMSGMDTTREDPAHNTPELRLMHYGQEDHVRLYGKDFPGKLRNAGFAVEAVNLTEGLPPHELLRYGLGAGGQTIFKCTVPKD